MLSSSLQPVLALNFGLGFSISALTDKSEELWPRNDYLLSLGHIRLASVSTSFCPSKSLSNEEGTLLKNHRCLCHPYPHRLRSFSDLLIWLPLAIYRRHDS
ncbi:hypothetical protein ONS96_004747 [Cadophora gregata f. sp. sojae]|nr:hypothetical protein ONS96_004747 [Cadophora gregata f. sp. sojae]